MDEMKTAHLLYNVTLRAVHTFLPLAARLKSALAHQKEKSKLQKFVEFQAESNEKLRNLRVASSVWIHVSSLGEFAVVRPIISELKRRGHRVVLTFFSPTGYEALRNHSHGNVDEVLFLPIDTPENAQSFVERVHPELAVFAVSEIWVNHLDALHAKGIPAFLVAAKITEHSAAMKFYGGLLRRTMKHFRKIMVLDAESERLLKQKGFTNVVRTGDSLFDNARYVAAQAYDNVIVEKFCGKDKVFIAGSISDEKDLSFVCHLANTHRDAKFIFVPHEISEESITDIKMELRGSCKCFSECDEATDMSKVQVLVIDFIGALAYIYRYCSYAYVGGGFTPYLHSIIEPVVYGIPIAFGPVIHRKHAAVELKRLGVAEIVRKNEDIAKWFAYIKNNESLLQSIRQRALDYVNENANATETILRNILNEKP